MKKSQFEKNRYGRSYIIFSVFNHIFIILVALICLLPMLHILAMSLSDNIAISQGRVSFYPVNFTTAAYEYLLRNMAFWRSMLISFQRVVLGLVVNLFLVILTAYPLSMSTSKFPHRKKFAWFFLVTMLFGGGLIPTYLTVLYTGLTDSIWALIIPGALPVYNMILMLNFFRQLPESVSESAFIDGAGHWKTLWKIVVPMSLPAIATIALFVIVGHWNEWFTPILYMKRVDSYPMQTYLRTLIIDQNFEMSSPEDVEMLRHLSNRTISSAQIFVGMIPVLAVYPFLQKYFTKGIVLGSVKG